MYYVDYLQIRSNSAVIYSMDVDRQFSGRSIQSALTANLVAQSTGGSTYSGELRKGTKKRLTKAVEFLIMVSKKRRINNTVIGKKHHFTLGFTTLTLADNMPEWMLEHTLVTSVDETGKISKKRIYLFPEERKKYFKRAYKKMLEPTLKWMRQTQSVTSYVWKAELQERGQIHWHITADTFIDCNELQTKWDKLQIAAGYQDVFFKTNGYYSTAAVQVKAVKSARLTSYYFQKEISKGFQNEDSLGTKVWDCSKNLKGNRYPTFECPPELTDGQLREMSKARDIFVHFKDRCRIIELLGRNGTFFLTNPQIREYNEYISRIKYSRQKEVLKAKPAAFVRYEQLIEAERIERIDKIKTEYTKAVKRNYLPIVLTRNIQYDLFKGYLPNTVKINLCPHWFSSS